MKIIRRLLPLIGILLFIRLVSSLSWEKFFAAVLQLELSLILLVSVGAISGLLLKGMRWCTYFRGMSFSVPDLLRVFYAAMFYGLVSPGRIGELLKIGFLRERGFKLREAVFYTIYDRFFDVLFLLFCTYGLFLFYFGNVFYFSVIIPLYLLVFIGQKKLFFIFTGRNFCWPQLLRQWILTLCSYFVYAAGFSLLLHPEKLFFFIRGMLAACAGNLIALLPISFYGIGTKEQLYFFVFKGLPGETIIISSLLHLIITLISTAVFCSFFLRTDHHLPPSSTAE
jgi:hypothetical protein